MESQDQEPSDHYWPTSELLMLHPHTRQWTALKTGGHEPSRCSGAAGCVLDEVLYVVAGFHRVPVRFRLGRYQFNSRGPPHDAYSESEDEEEQEEEEEEEEYQQNWNVEISNGIWTLDLIKFTWTKLEPTGNPPLSCDKTACWSYKNKIYMFGGFGPPPSSAQRASMGNLCTFVEDATTNRGLEGFTRGWSNQLVAYDTAANRWEWPLCSGRAPSPRAAHSVALVPGTSTAYVFGGRSGDKRLNDLHALDLETLQWTELISDTGGAEGLDTTTPSGRSWQTMNSIETSSDEGGLLLYGGFDNGQAVLDDCWRLDLAARPLQWTKCPHLEQGPRLWHAGVCTDSSQLVIVGGLTNNILAPSFVAKHHAKETLLLRVGPPTLLKTCLEFIWKHPELFKDHIEDLPRPLSNIAKMRYTLEGSGA